MKRCVVLLVLVCLLLTACTGGPVPTEAPSAGTTVQTGATTVPMPTGETTVPNTDPTSPETAKVTVYLLEKAAFYDSGYTAFEYDDQYNVTSYCSRDIEENLRCNGYFEDPDANGMPRKLRVVWPDGETSSKTLTYFGDGKMESEQEDGFDYTGYQYAYDAKGDLIEKREYYDGILQSTVSYQYDGETLTNVFCEDADGTVLYDTVVEDGRVVKEQHYGAGTYDVFYTYDEHGNLVSTAMDIDGERQPVSEYSYKAVQLDAERAYLLASQQRYVMSTV